MEKQKNGHSGGPHLPQLLANIFGKGLGGRKSQLAHFKKKRSEFFEDMATAYDDGIAVIKYIATSAEREKKSGSPTMAAALLQIQKAYLAAGNSDQPFSEALRGFIPESERILLMAYERDGQLGEGLLFVAQTAAQVAEMRSTLISAITSPLVTLSITIFTVWMYAHEVIPMLESMIDEKNWSSMMRVLRGFSIALKTFGAPFAILAGVSLAVVVYQLPRWTGSRRRWFDDKVFSVYRDYVGALFLLSYSALLHAGVGQAEALQMIARNSPRWLRWHCQQILNRLSRFHDQPGLAFDTGIFPESITNRLIATASSSKSQEIFKKMGSRVIAQTNKRYQAQSARIGTLVEVSAGAVTLLLTLAIASIASTVSGT